MPIDTSTPKLKTIQPLTKRGDIHLGDLATALSQLSGTTFAEQDIIAHCLGFQLQVTDRVAEPKYQAVKAAWNRPLLKYQKPSPGKPPSYTPSLTMPPGVDTITTSVDDVLEADLQIETVTNYKLNSTVESQILNSTVLTERTIPALPRQTLFPKKTARGAVSAAVTRQVPGQDLDVAKLILSLVQQKPLKKLPVLPQLTVRNGCQLLLDFNDALMPWWEDMQTLILQFQQVLGETLCPVYEFSQNPLLATRWTETAEIPWQPVANKPVIIATDLGVIQAPIGQRIRPSKAEWLEFINRCKKKKTPVTILFPLHPQRCPYDLDKLTTLIHWHPATSSAMIKRLIAHSGNSQ